jgi:hypothetical protein
MKAFLTGVVVAITFGFAAAVSLSKVQTLAYQAFVTSGAQLTDPGHNLVGADWSGNRQDRSGTD